jgi:hypothetical protein
MEIVCITNAASTRRRDPGDTRGSVSWIRRLWSRVARSASEGRTALYWGDHLWLVQPPPERDGVVAGRLRVARARTWASATIERNEHLGYPALLALEADDGVFVPLKLAPADPVEFEQLRRDAEAWQPGTDGPPFERPEDPWLDESHALAQGWTLDAPVELRGLCYPMFSAGTIVSFRVWGYYVRAAVAVTP